MAKKIRYQVTARDKKGNIVSQNIRYTKANAAKLAKKNVKRKNIQSASIKAVK